MDIVISGMPYIFALGEQHWDDNDLDSVASAAAVAVAALQTM